MMVMRFNEKEFVVELDEKRKYDFLKRKLILWENKTYFRMERSAGGCERQNKRKK